MRRCQDTEKNVAFLDQPLRVINIGLIYSYHKPLGHYYKVQKMSSKALKQ